MSLNCGHQLVLFILKIMYEYGEPLWNDIDRGNMKNFDKTQSQCYCVTTNTIWNDPDAKTGLRDERPATNPLNHGKAL
jgi:hypothetical protein